MRSWGHNRTLARCGTGGALARLCLLLLLALGLGPNRTAWAEGGPGLALHQVDWSRFPAVTIYASVVDGRGVPIVGLGKDDLEVVEDGARVPGWEVSAITASQEPLAVALVVDTSGSMAGAPLAEAQKAAEGFVAGLGGKDIAALIAFATEVRVAQGFTADKALLQKAIAGLKAQGDTALYDALYQASQLLMALPQPRKVLVLLTDGEDTKSRLRLSAAVAAAREAKALVFTVGLGPEVQRGVLDEIARATGAVSRYTATPEELAATFRAIGDQLRRQYALSYTSRLPADGKEHQLSVRVKYQGQTAEVQTAFIAQPNPPTIEIRSLASGETLSATRTVGAEVSAMAPVTKVEFFVDEELAATKAAPPYTYDWNTARLRPGLHRLRVVAHDAAGNKSSKEVFVNIVAVPVPPTPAVAPEAAAVREAAPPPPAPAAGGLGWLLALGVALVAAAGGGAFLVLQTRFRGGEARAPEMVVCERCGAARPPGVPYCPVCAAAVVSQPPPAGDEYGTKLLVEPPRGPQEAGAAADRYGTRLMGTEGPPADSYATQMLGVEAAPADEAATRLMEAAPAAGKEAEEWLGGATIVKPRPRPQARLLVKGRGGEQAFSLTKPETTLGRAPENDICLWDPRASRDHARVFLEGMEFWLEDRGSTNGTLVNNRLIQRCPLKDGDAIVIGDTPIIFQLLS